MKINKNRLTGPVTSNPVFFLVVPFPSWHQKIPAQRKLRYNVAMGFSLEKKVDQAVSLTLKKTQMAICGKSDQI